MAETVRINFVTGAARRYVPEIEALAAIPERVASAVGALGEGAFRHAPAEGEWSPARIVGHLIAYSRQSRENLQRMAWMTDPVLRMTDDAGEAERHAWESREQAQLLGWLAETIAESVHLLEELPDASWGRAGLHPTAGRRAIVEQVRAMVAHCEEHAGQLERARGG